MVMEGDLMQNLNKTNIRVENINKLCLELYNGVKPDLFTIEVYHDTTGNPIQMKIYITVQDENNNEKTYIYEVLDENNINNFLLSLKTFLSKTL